MSYRAPIGKPVTTSFGTMRDRPAVFLRVEDADGCFGWGEIFANWPASGAEHRVRLLIEDIADLALNTPISDPASLFEELTRRSHIRALQCGEWGPFQQAIAGLDIAMHDLFARRENLSLCQFLNKDSRAVVPYYASGIHVNDADAAILNARRAGAKDFKVKVGFNVNRDIAAICELRSGLDQDETLFADANQAWDLSAATEFLDGIPEMSIGWLEEPMPADACNSEWNVLASRTNIPLAGGENLSGYQAFADAITGAAFGVIQPDIVKWGGITGCFSVAKKTLSAGSRYCPHFLGGGIGLIASAHLLAAVGGDGLLEVDANPNPLRDLLAPAKFRTGGVYQITKETGLGVVSLPAEFRQFRTHYQETSA